MIHAQETPTRSKYLKNELHQNFQHQKSQKFYEPRRRESRTQIGLDLF